MHKYIIPQSLCIILLIFVELYKFNNLTKNLSKIDFKTLFVFTSIQVYFYFFSTMFIFILVYVFLNIDIYFLL